ncbi:MAG: tyrosine-type recombinase/integrase, partial [Chloroflexota bacterium]|nr:tyrosine-type recombinase/integrase [Chloroflexota bacterium]
MNRWVRAAGLISPRTGKPLHLTPRRLRYTLATEMAREGASRHKIADVLDHTDLQNVEVYIEAASYIVTQINGERNGLIVEMTTHAFRHWVTTQAAIGGIDDALLARW